MHWFFIVIISPFLYAITNHIDKILLEKHFKHKGGVGTLFLISALLSFIPLPFLVLYDPGVLSISLENLVVMSFVGFLNALLIWCYLSALQDDEASITIVFYQLVPVFGYILGFIILDEVLTKFQLIAMAIVILGTSIISFEIDAENKFKLRKKTIGYMLCASLAWALGAVIFKAVALEESVVKSLFWEHVVLVLIGVIVFATVRSYRESLLVTLKKNSKPVLSLNALNEVLYMGGNIIAAFVYLMAPIALVLLIDSFQPIFVLGIGIFLTIFFPAITAEKIETKHLWQKILAILITSIGTYMLIS